MDLFCGYETRIIHVTVGNQTFELLCPSDADALLDRFGVAQRYETDAYLPYWAQLWPCGLMLADKLMEWGPPSGSPPKALEIGCGLGVVTLSLAHLGYSVWSSDYEADALEFLRNNLHRNSLPCAELVVIDWRERYQELSFDRIFASDILYETRYLRPVAEFVHNHLNPQGLAFIADSNRTIADDFETVAKHSGLSVKIFPAERMDTEKQKLIKGRIFQLARA